MATEEEKKNQQDLNESKLKTVELTQEELGILESVRRATQSRVTDENDILNYIRETNNVLNDQFKVSKNISVEKDLAKKVSREILNINENLNTILQNELGLEKTSNSLTKTRQKLIKDQLTLQTLLNTQFTEDAELNFEINKQLKEQIGNIDKLLGKVKIVEEESKKIKDNFGVKSFAGLEKIAKEIPILRKFTEPLSKATEASRLQAVSNKFTANQRKTLQEQIKGDQQRLANLQKIAQAEGKGIKKGALKEFGFGNLSGTAASAKARSLQKGVNANLAKNMGALKALPKAINPLIAGLKALASTLKTAMKAFVIVDFVAAIIQGDKATGDLAKSMNITYLKANELRGELNNIANLSGDNFVTTKGLQETLTAINGTLGTNVMLNEENLKTFTKLRKVAGLTNDELMGVQSIVNATGGDLEDATGEILAQAKISSARLGVALNEKEVLKSIKNVSAATTLSLGKNPGLIADAVATAKSLGFELSKIEQISESLLQFESSIEAELEAELLLGKSINLEKARQFALDNDLAGVAREISAQMGSAAEFSEMNFLQQSAIAKAVGMNRNELAKTLFVQEQLLNVSGDEAKVRERRINFLIEEKGLAEAQRVLAEEGIEGLEAQASIGEQFNQSMEKLKELFVSLSPIILKIGYALIPILEQVGKLLEFVAPIMGTLGGVAAGAAVGSAFGGVGAIPGAIIGGIVGTGANPSGFANGGVATGPDSGYQATLHGTEAVVPLGNSRSIPVELKGAGLASYMDSKNSINPSSEIKSQNINLNNSELIAEIKALRSDLIARPIEVVSTLTMDGKVVAEQIGRNNSDQLGNGLNASNYNIQ